MSSHALRNTKQKGTQTEFICDGVFAFLKVYIVAIRKCNKASVGNFTCTPLLL